MKYHLVILTLFAVSFPGALYSADWNGFRGPLGNPVHDGTLPLNWNTQDKTNIAWEQKLPGRGVSGPIAVGDKIIVTASGGVNQQRLFVLCFDQKSGKPVWKRNFWATGRTYSHPTSANAAPTPVSDGTSVFAFFSSNDLICLDLDGNLKWFRGLAHDYPKAGNDVGMAASPVVAGNVVIVQIENQGDSFACGIDKTTGVEIWRIPRDARANWCSPTTYVHPDGSPIVVLQSGSGLTALDAETGKPAWKLGISCGTIASPLVIQDKLYVASQGTTKLDLASNSTDPEVIWSENKLGLNATSPLVHDGIFYGISGSIIKGANASTGQVLWQLRLRGRFWASPIYSNQHLYCINQDGQVHIIKLSGGPEEQTAELVSEFEMGEPVLGTPAAAGNSLFIRSDKHLWRISN